MIGVIVDPALLAVPPVADSEAEVEEIIERLMVWSHFAVRGRLLRVLQMSETADVLVESNCWPSGPNVASLLELYNLGGIYSQLDVSRLINSIIERASSVINVLGFEV